MAMLLILIVILFNGTAWCGVELGSEVPQNSSEAKQVQIIPAETQVTKIEQKKAPVKEAQPPATTWFFSQKTLSNMSYQELKDRKNELVKSDKKTAIKYLERMSHIQTDYNELKQVTLELAQLLLDTEDYTKSSKLFHEFTLLFPGSQEAEFALYQAIFASFKQILDPEHDQTKTIETLELAQTFLERNSFTTYKKEVQDIVIKCDQRLFESEVNIFNFYIKRENYAAAKSRLSGIKLTYGKKEIPHITKQLADLEASYTIAAVDYEAFQKTILAAADKEKQKEIPETTAAEQV